MRIALRTCMPLALSLAACAHPARLAPAPGAQTVPGDARVAEATVDGVRVRVDPGAWRSGTVRDVLVPVKVTIENRGEHRLRLGHGEFTLGAGAASPLAALPPDEVAAGNASVLQPGGFGPRTFLTPWTNRSHDRPGAWQGAFPEDAAYHDRDFAVSPARLPDRAVLRQALPEGVLEPGGEAAGFLYFAEQPQGTQLTLFASLVDADLGQSVGTVAIPFVVK